MVGSILLLAITIFGILILLGKSKSEHYYKFLIWLIFSPPLLAVGYSHAVWLWAGLPLFWQVLSISLFPFFASVILRLMFPKARWLQVLPTALFQTLVYAATFPFRLFWRAGRFFFERERQINRQNPYRPAVGARPPVENERRDGDRRGNIFD